MNFTDIENKRKTRNPVIAIAGIDEKINNKKQEILEDKEQKQEEQIKRGRPKENREIKKRVSLAIYPSIYEDIGKIAYVDRESISEVISKCIENYIKKNHDKLKEYERIKNKGTRN